MARPRSRDAVRPSDPRRTWNTIVLDLGEPRLSLRQPLPVTLEEYDSDFVASWPEVEAWGAGRTEADAINAFKDDVVNLYEELGSAPQRKLGKLPRRWKQTLDCVVVASGGRRR